MSVEYYAQRLSELFVWRSLTINLEFLHNAEQFETVGLWICNVVSYTKWASRSYTIMMSPTKARMCSRAMELNPSEVLKARVHGSKKNLPKLHLVAKDVILLIVQYRPLFGVPRDRSAE